MKWSFRKLSFIGVIVFTSLSILITSQNKQEVQVINTIRQIKDKEQTTAPKSKTQGPFLELSAADIAQDTAKKNADDHKISKPSETNEFKPVEIDYKKVKPNEIGEIMIVMYHGLLYDKPSTDYHRNVNDFKNDLKVLYEKGYRLVPLQDLIDNNIKVEAGRTPIVLTFDDGLSSAFSLETKDGVLVPKVDCAVDIINKFSEQYPDFGRAAVFYINGTREAFIGDGTLPERFDYLISNGYEIGNHTYSHSQLSKLDKTQIQNEIASVHNLVKQNTNGYVIKSLTYPYGLRPKQEFINFALSGTYGGIEYEYSWAIREGQSGASAAPNNIAFDPLNIPRVRGTSNAVTDFGWFLDFYEKNPSLKYVSDGDPNQISVPKSKKESVKQESIKDKSLYFYE